MCDCVVMFYPPPFPDGAGSAAAPSRIEAPRAEIPEPGGSRRIVIVIIVVIAIASLNRNIS